MALCPLCEKEIPRFCVEPNEFDCPHCFQKLTPDYFTGYWLLRGLVCLPAGLAGAWVCSDFFGNGWLLRIVTFVLWGSLLVAGPFALWDFIVKHVFLPKRFAVAPSTYLVHLKLNPK
jgi:hypothetical protein